MSAVKTIGIIGGGQLGLMIIEQAHLLGARTICLDPAEDAPAFKISDERIVGRFDDPAALRAICWWLSSKNTISNKGSGLCSTRRIACGRRAMPAIMD